MWIQQFMLFKIPPNLPLLKGGTFSDYSQPDSPLLQRGGRGDLYKRNDMPIEMEQ